METKEGWAVVHEGDSQTLPKNIMNGGELVWCALKDGRVVVGSCSRMKDGSLHSWMLKKGDANYVDCGPFKGAVVTHWKPIRKPEHPAA